MRVLIVGLGSIGRRHLANLALIEPDAQVTVWHQHSRASSWASNLPFQVVYQLEDAIASRPDVALICSPAPLHTETALALAQHNIHLFIEKPLSNTLDRVDDLIQLCHRQNLALMVGYNFRFYQPLQVIRQLLLDGKIGRVLTLRADVGQDLPEWRPDKDYRDTVSARYDLGGGVLLELSHEIDYVRWLLGEVQAVTACVAHLSDLEIDVEDTAELILQFNNHALGSIHLNMVQHPAGRTCRIVGTEGTIIWDMNAHRVQLFSTSVQTWVDVVPTATLDRNEMYRMELIHFFDCVRNHTSPLVSGEDGYRVLQIILAAKQSSQEQRTIKL